MNTILIISIILTIVAAGLYFMAKREVEKQKESVKYWMDRYDLEEKSNLEYSETIKSYENALIQASQEKDQLSQKLDRAESEYSKCEDLLNAKKEELANFQQLILEHENSRSVTDTKLFEAVKTDDFPFQFRTLIDWADIEIAISDLIDDKKLFEVFISLLNSNLLPDSIIQTIDYNKGDGQVIIYTQEFNEEGEVLRALTWREITDQILSKKQIVTDYLKTVIQDSDRAMVVHQALSNKKGKEVAA